MYSKVKRTRQTRIRYSSPPQVELRESRLRPRDRTSSRVVAESESESEESDDSTEVGRRQTRGRGQRRVYHLRQNKPMVDRFQVNSSKLRYFMDIEI